MKKYKVLTFDIVGTLINFEKGILDWLYESSPQLKWDEQTILQTWSEQERYYIEQYEYIPFRMMYNKIIAYILESFGQRFDSNDQASFNKSIAKWPAFFDSVNSMAALSEHFTLVAATNADNRCISEFEITLGHPFTHTYSSEDFGVYKPGSAYFNTLQSKIGQLGFEQGQWLHIAQSQYHDIIPISQMGVDTAWIERRAQRSGSGATPNVKIKAPTFHFNSMDQLVSGLSQL